VTDLNGRQRHFMARYRARVQLIHWYELTVQADSAEEASSRAEALSPRQIMARGKVARIETGLADPRSLEVIKPK
jgi:hypothetical protein